ncbi:MAG: HAD-IIIA family hydrolase, partial [Patescibacteria group bacterium]
MDPIEARIKQAVILAGGRGERLRPFTDNLPKPMVPINGKPFLEYLVGLLRENGIKEIVMLLGYLPEKITDYFGDGSKFGVSIRYSIGAADDETGTRIRNAAPFLDDEFLLMYCDNYWPLNLKTLEEFSDSHPGLLTVTVYGNKKGITNNNMFVDEDGYITVYDKSRTNRNVNGVDAGYFIAKKEILNLMPADNFSFEKVVFPALIEKKQFAGYLTDQRYYSIGSIDRLPTTEKFLGFQKVVFLDRDGVINKRPPKADYVKNWREFEFLPGAIEAIKLLNDNHYRVYVISNQPGIARGVMTKNDLDAINSNFEAELSKHGAKVDDIYMCFHGWDEGCDCRKPKPGLFFDASFDHEIDLRKAVYIGDDERDDAAGKAADCQTILIES